MAEHKFLLKLRSITECPWGDKVEPLHPLLPFPNCAISVGGCFNFRHSFSLVLLARSCLFSVCTLFVPRDALCNSFQWQWQRQATFQSAVATFSLRHFCLLMLPLSEGKVFVFTLKFLVDDDDDDNNSKLNVTKSPKCGFSHNNSSNNNYSKQSAGQRETSTLYLYLYPCIF